MSSCKDLSCEMPITSGASLVIKVPEGAATSLDSIRRRLVAELGMAVAAIVKQQADLMAMTPDAVVLYGWRTRPEDGTQEQLRVMDTYRDAAGASKTLFEKACQGGWKLSFLQGRSRGISACGRGRGRSSSRAPARTHLCGAALKSGGKCRRRPQTGRKRCAAH